ncbi:MAG: hypothetical protein WEC12_01245, partial [Balneolaceae bacterium]
RGMIQELFDGTYTNECALVFGCSYRTDLLYVDYLKEMESSHHNFHYMKSISREDRREDGCKQYVQTKLIDEQEFLRPILGRQNTLIYICGLKGMEEGIYKELINQEFYSYIELKKDLPEDLEALDGREFKRIVKPSSRVFEEVY